MQSPGELWIHCSEFTALNSMLWILNKCIDILAIFYRYTSKSHRENPPDMDFNHSLRSKTYGLLSSPSKQKRAMVRYDISCIVVRTACSRALCYGACWLCCAGCPCVSFPYLLVELVQFVHLLPLVLLQLLHLLLLLHGQLTERRWTGGLDDSREVQRLNALLQSRLCNSYCLTLVSLKTIFNVRHCQVLLKFGSLAVKQVCSAH